MLNFTTISNFSKIRNHMKNQIQIQIKKTYISKTSQVPKILITGANGSVGKPLTKALISKYGSENCIATDVRSVGLQQDNNQNDFDVIELDVMNKQNYQEIVKENKITKIIHLADLLTQSCEENLELGMNLNVGGAHNALDIAKNSDCSVFIASSVASFGHIKHDKAIPDDYIQTPESYYGISKAYIENLGNYYNKKFNTDFRCLRYPVIVSPYKIGPGRVMTFSNDMYLAAVKKQEFYVPIYDGIVLPYMYIDDCVRGTMELIFADSHDLSRRVYNFQGTMFSAKQMIKELQKKTPDFVPKYKFDKEKNSLASCWPCKLDDNLAKKDWNWSPKYNNLNKLTRKMISEIKNEIKREKMMQGLQIESTSGSSESESDSEKEIKEIRESDRKRIEEINTLRTHSYV